MEQPGDWREHAACRGVDPDLFFPARGDTEGFNRAVAICKTCPVADHCLAWAMNTREITGVWGGKSANERKLLSAGWRRTTDCQRCGTTFMLAHNRPSAHCQDCRPAVDNERKAAHARVLGYDPKRCPVCRCEFSGYRDCCSQLCLKVWRRTQVAS